MGEKSEGIAALAVTLMVGGLVVEVALAGLLVAYFLNQSGYGAVLSADALGAARSGIDDGLLRIIRDKTTGYTVNTIPLGSWSASVTICKDSKTVTTPCDTPQIGKDEITSLGVALVKRRRLRAIVNVGSATGDVRVESLNEISL